MYILKSFQSCSEKINLKHNFNTKPYKKLQKQQTKHILNLNIQPLLQNNKHLNQIIHQKQTNKITKHLLFQIIDSKTNIHFKILYFLLQNIY